MPLANRVTPEGRFLSGPRTCLFMGNRGILHDANGQIVRTHRNRAWITCLLQFKGRRRPLLQPGCYTELFFLDEATAFAAGHRPCFECRRSDARAFRAAWAAANPQHDLRQIDASLHAERIARAGVKLTWFAPLSTLPDGVFLRHSAGSLLLHRGRLWLWHLSGYQPFEESLPAGVVEVLTPPSIVRAFQAGYRPAVHPSAT